MDCSQISAEGALHIFVVEEVLYLVLRYISWYIMANINSSTGWAVQDTNIVSDDHNFCCVLRFITN